MLCKIINFSPYLKYKIKNQWNNWWMLENKFSWYITSIKHWLIYKIYQHVFRLNWRPKARFSFILFMLHVAANRSSHPVNMNTWVSAHNVIRHKTYLLALGEQQSLSAKWEGGGLGIERELRSRDSFFLFIYMCIQYI